MKRIRWSESEEKVFWNSENGFQWADCFGLFSTDYRGSEWADIASMTWNPETGVTHIVVKEPVLEKTLLECAEAYLQEVSPDPLRRVRAGEPVACLMTYLELVAAIDRERAKPSPKYTDEAVDELLDACKGQHFAVDWAWEPREDLNVPGSLRVWYAFQVLLKQREASGK